MIIMLGVSVTFFSLVFTLQTEYDTFTDLEYCSKHVNDQPERAGFICKSTSDSSVLTGRISFDKKANGEK